uniref:Uncharacterized protein n=1 Tax=Ananas comosus var. bracteatus TaxID=296719 RepID=A0A6V7PJB2_ANACO|nr:unnamed protein product [Ananas comosus var. bracteatus]
MERKVVVVCGVVGFLGLLSAALGFAAEGTRVKASDVQTTGADQCIYPRSPALVLGLASAVALMMAQAIINTVAGCICCKKHPHPSGTNWTVGLISFIVSWVTFIIAFLLLLTGAALNDQRGEESMYFGSFCYVVKPGINSEPVWGPQQIQNHGIAMGQPVIPPQSTQPVFVHEDTYNRQQFP